MAHLITKQTQIPREVHIYPSNEQEVHYILEWKNMLLHNIFILVVQLTGSGVLKQVILATFRIQLGGTVLFGCFPTSKFNRFDIVNGYYL